MIEFLMLLAVILTGSVIGWAIGMKMAAELLRDAVGEIADRISAELKCAVVRADMPHKEEWYEGCIWALQEVMALYDDEK